MEENDLLWQSRDEMDKPTNALQSLLESYTMTAKDMSENKFDAWVYGIIAGWDDDCYAELAQSHNWRPEQVAYNKMLHANYNEAWKLWMEKHGGK